MREGVVEQADDLRVQCLVLGGVLGEAAEEGEGLAELEKDGFSVAHTTMPSGRTMPVLSSMASLLNRVSTSP